MLLSLEFQLERLQAGHEPKNWKPLTNPSKGTTGVRKFRAEIDTNIYRSAYLTKFGDGTVMLHCRNKKINQPLQISTLLKTGTNQQKYTSHHCCLINLKLNNLMIIKTTKSLPFDKRFSQYNDSHCPGLAVMVIQDGVTKFKKGYGLSNLETKEKVEPDTNFRMASVSKQFTAMAVAILEERKTISREDYISHYLADTPEYMKGIKIKHLVHHLSGLPDYAVEKIYSYRQV